ncbi:Rossmann-fold NAD(P)-binding domain-containing protein [Maribacter antarcticus]|uniref:hypothetical protein n=1 Tax=Maribacter antarcticus TaxID=505250 RepID=UPI000A598A24|nr:hypothetical protein [Maribacter antarcticus]
MAKDGDAVEVFRDGKQTVSFLYIDECIEGVIRFMKSDFKGPINIGSEEMINMNEFIEMIIKTPNKDFSIKNIPFRGVGIRGRKSYNTLIENKLK